MNDMNKKTFQKNISLTIVVCMAAFIIHCAGTQPARAEESWFNITTFGSALPETDMETTDARFSSASGGLNLSATILSLGYTVTAYAWNNDQDALWGDQVQQLSLNAMYGGDMTEKWSYLMMSTGVAAFEEEIEQSFLSGMLVSGLKYTVSEHWAVQFGGGVAYTDFETMPFPAGGVQWNLGRGLSLSFIFPVESTLTYTSAHEKLMVSVDFFHNPSAQVAYALTPALRMYLNYQAPNPSVHRLSEENSKQYSAERTYLETNAQTAGIGFSYSPSQHLTLTLGGQYLVSREYSIHDKNDDEITTFEPEDTFGGIVSLTYAF